MNRHDVCPLESIPDGTMKQVRVAGRNLVLVRNGERIFALRDRCPHQGARLSDGIVTCTRASGDVGQFLPERDGQIIRCPWHNWEFDAEDGMCLHNPDSVRVATYRVQIENERVMVSV
jgi:nitrite reductase (NADH) small subunit